MIFERSSLLLFVAAMWASLASTTICGHVCVRAHVPQGNVIVARQAALRYADKGIVSISLNPGKSPSRAWPVPRFRPLS